MQRAVRAKKTAKPKAKAKRPAHRPTKFKADYCAQVEKLCLLGATDVQIAAFFGTSQSTIDRWKHAHPDFRESITRGKEIADMEVVKSLYRRATGFEVEVQKVAGSGADAKVMTLTAYVEPDTDAAKFWLKNRRPATWRDKHDVEHGGTVHLTHEERLALLE